MQQGIAPQAAAIHDSDSFRAVGRRQWPSTNGKAAQLLSTGCQGHIPLSIFLEEAKRGGTGGGVAPLSGHKGFDSRELITKGIVRNNSNRQIPIQFYLIL